MGEKMRLELTVSKDIVRKKFNIDDKYNICRERLNKHKLVVSNELLKLWEQDAVENKYITQFENWYFSIISSNKKLSKVKMLNINEVKKAETHEEEIMIGTALSTKDKFLVSDINIEARRKNKEVSFVSEGVFIRDKIQTVTMKDIRNVVVRKKNYSLFDIYETPVRLEVSLDSDSQVLSEYLSRFFKDSKTLLIKDRYITQPENERNLNKYILSHIDKNCLITFIMPNSGKRESMIEKFKNYNGYKSNVTFIDRKHTHQSYIESDEFIIDLGYRLRVFGDIDDGKTEQEVITITKK